MDLSRPSPAGSRATTTNHLVLAGPLDSGKSSLSIGIGTEFAIRMGIGRYTTLAKLLQSALKEDGQWDQPEFDDGRILWPWQTSDLLVVDDVDVLSDHIPGTPLDVETERGIAECRMEALKKQIPAPLLDALKYRRTVWVVGDIDDGELTRWTTNIASVIGVPPDHVRRFKFNQRLKDLPPDRPMPSVSERVKQ